MGQESNATASSPFSSPAASPSPKRIRDLEDDVYVDNLHFHKRYLSEEKFADYGFKFEWADGWRSPLKTLWTPLQELRACFILEMKCPRNIHQCPNIQTIPDITRVLQTLVHPNPRVFPLVQYLLIGVKNQHHTLRLSLIIEARTMRVGSHHHPVTYATRLT